MNSQTGAPYLEVGCVSQLEAVEHGCIVSVQLHQVVMVTLLHDAPVPHQEDVVTVHQVLRTQVEVTCFNGLKFVTWAWAHLQLVRHKHHSLVMELLLDGVVKNVVGHVGVERAQWVIKDVDITVTVQSTGQADSLPLPAAQVGTALTNLVGRKEEPHVRCHPTTGNYGTPVMASFLKS